jgi:cytochrome c oxidase subunit 2
VRYLWSMNSGGVSPLAVWWVLLALGVAWTAVWGWVLLHAGPGPSYATMAPRVSSLRRALFGLLLAASAVAFAVTVRAYPSLPFRTRALGAPTDTVEAQASQWSWALSRTELPSGRPVEFAVTSEDVNHGLGIYDSDGVLLTQVQAMPGYTNRLVYRFAHPGAYTIRCLEYCGIFHHIMLATLTVR